MSTARSSVILPFAWLALASCAEPKFPAADGSAPDTALPPIENYTCEEPDQVFCASGDCGRICHKTDVERKPVAGHCDVPVFVDGKRYDNCEDNSVCLEPAPNTSQGHFCFRLCTNVTDCSGGVACAERSLSKDASLRVCDPSYQNCEGGCCDPTTGTGSTCSFNRPCYLVEAPDVNPGTSWTVCEYAGGGARKTESCTWARDCIEGLTCMGAKPGIKDSGTCVVVCDPSKPSACGVDGHCQPFPKQWGYCL